MKQWQKIEQLVKEGKTLEELFYILNSPKSTIYQVAHRHGFSDLLLSNNKEEYKQQITPEEVKTEVVNLIKSGECCSSICLKLNLTNKIVRSIAKKNNLELSLHENFINNKPKTKEEIRNAEIVKLFLGGTKPKELLDLFDVSDGVLRRIFKENNLSEQFKSSKKGDKSPHPNKLNAFERYKEFDLEFGSAVEQQILEGKHQQQLLKNFGISGSFLTRFLKWKNPQLKQVLMETGERIRYSSEGKSRPSVLKGQKLKVLSSEHFARYNDLVEQGVHLAKIRRIFKEEFNYGPLKIKELLQSGNIPKKFDNTGKNNYMFGKEPATECGNGISGHYINRLKSKVLFRSLLELLIFTRLDKSNVNWTQSKHVIPYFFNGKTRNYFPDIVIENKVCEIKPKYIVDDIKNKAKFEAAREYCLKNGLEFEVLTEEFLNKTIVEEEVIYSLINDGLILLSEKQFERLKRNLHVYYQKSKHK